MKIAVTHENGNIFQHFGHTEQFKIYDVVGEKITSSIVVDTNGHGHGALADLLRELQVSVLICGGIGGGAQMALASANIQLYGGVSGDADQAVEALLANALQYNPNVKCNHHEHEHECECGHHEHDHHHDHDHECECGHHEHHHNHHEHHHDHEEGCCCCGHDHDHHHHHADEVFESIGVETTKKSTAEGIKNALEKLEDEHEYGFVLRAKGIVEGHDGQWIHFDYVPGEPDVRLGNAEVMGRLCIIGSKMNKDAVRQLFEI